MMFPLFRRGPTIGEWRAAYLGYAQRFGGTSQQGKARAFRRLASSVSDKTSTKKLTKSAVLALLQQVARDTTGGAANETAKHLRAAWSWGELCLGLPANPFAGISKQPHDEHPRYVPPVTDFGAVLAVAESLKDRTMLVLALHTAARRGEIFRLRWEDVDFDRGMIQFGTRKRAGGGMQYDWIAMSDALAGILAEYRAMTDGYGLVFTAPGGREYKTRSTWLRKLCHDAGVRRFGFHGLRHLSASLMAEAGLSIPTIQSVLRHRNPQTTSIYLHKIGSVREKLDRAFAVAGGMP